jgi:hypothetical protein
MRIKSLVTAKALISKNIVDKSYFGLIYHDQNQTILNKWQAYKELCAESERDNLFEIKASDLASIEKDDTYRNYLRNRYLI